MLYVVLLLVLAALGSLVAALVTADSLWAWLSIGLSVLAGLVMILDLLRRRSARKAQADSPPDEPDDTPDDEDDVADSEKDATAAGEGVTEGSGDPERVTQETQFMPAVGASLTGDTPAEDVMVNGDPAEEQTDAADLLIVAELADEVVVVDEYPRYHLESCGWLLDRETIPIEVAEARELGFTPCAVCGPDAELAAAHRTERRSKR